MGSVVCRNRVRMQRPALYARVVVDAVLSDRDLLGLILAGNVGPAALAAASCVCKEWNAVCRTDEKVLRGAAAYQGGLTKAVFMKLFAVSHSAADELPRSTHKRFRGGTYYLYGESAVDALLKEGGMAEWRIRLAARGAQAYADSWFPSAQLGFRQAYEQEERLRHRKGRGWAGPIPAASLVGHCTL